MNDFLQMLTICSLYYEHLSKCPDFEAVMGIFQAKFPQQDGNKADPETEERKAASLAFIDDLSKTTVFAKAWEYLQSVGEYGRQANSFATHCE